MRLPTNIFFSEGDTTSWFHYLCTITDIVNDTIPKYRVNNLTE